MYGPKRLYILNFILKLGVCFLCFSFPVIFAPWRAQSQSHSHSTSDVKEGHKKKLCIQIREKTSIIAKFIRMVQNTENFCQTAEALAQLQELDQYLTPADEFSKRHLSEEKNT
jgi:hypothetical protein